LFYQRIHYILTQKGCTIEWKDIEEMNLVVSGGRGHSYSLVIEVKDPWKYISQIRNPRCEIIAVLQKVTLSIFRNYLIIYRFKSPQLIEILTVHHHSREFSNNPAFKDEE